MIGPLSQVLAGVLPAPPSDPGAPDPAAGSQTRAVELPENSFEPEPPSAADARAEAEEGIFARAIDALILAAATAPTITGLPHERPANVRAPGEPTLPIPPAFGRDYRSPAGLRPNARALLDHAHRRGLGLTNGVQVATVPDHPAGRAIDVSNAHHPTPAMRKYAEDMRRTARSGNPMNVRIIIYDNQWAYAPRFEWERLVIPPGGWSGNPVSDRHEDHVHISTF